MSPACPCVGNPPGSPTTKSSHEFICPRTRYVHCGLTHTHVPVDVVRVRPTPRCHEVVLALERRHGRIPVADRPLQPAQELLRQMQEPLAFDGRITSRRADPHVVAEELEPRQQVAATTVPRPPSEG